MLGAQEILIISAFVAGAIIIPRMMNQNRPALRLVRPRKRLSGKLRMAIAASVLFPLIVAAVVQPWRKDFIVYLYMGIGPVAAGWLIFWVLRGFPGRS